MTALDIPFIVSTLINDGTDKWSIEAKSAAYGLPANIDETLSAFANMPEGGTIVLGLSEKDNEMHITGVDDAKKIIGALANKARKRISPPVQLGVIEQATINGRTVIACIVPPQPSDLRPFRVGKNGRSYIRTGDGDYQLSELEEQYLISNRGQPTHDLAPVHGADVDHDLVPELLEQYLEAQKSETYRLRAMGREELLIRTNVVDHTTGLPTVAAIYAMGIHPQQFLPHTTIKASASPGSPDTDLTLRFSDRKEFSGPIPDLLTAVTDWIGKHLMHTVTFSEGHGYNSPELPALAIREIVANALVHRDLSTASFGHYSMIRKEPARLIIKNPGGLWGLTTRELGKTSPRARNAVLYKMCSSITTSDGKRIIEGYATGIPAVIKSLNDAFLPAPYFADEVISFHVTLSSATMLSNEDLTWLASLAGDSQLGVAQKHALVAMRQGEEITNSSYRKRFPMDSTQARDQLQQLVRYGLADASGSGRGTIYRLAENHAQTSDTAPKNIPPTGTEPSLPKQNNHEEIVRTTVETASAPLSKQQIMALTGLSLNKVGRALKTLKDQEKITSTKAPSDGRVILYSPAAHPHSQ